MHPTRRIRNAGGWKAARMLRAAALLLALCLSGGVALRTGATGETYNWYCAHVRGHMQPRADGRFAFIRDCGGFYIDDRPEHTAADGADKVVYLTFDAGYENGNVARVLDALAQAAQLENETKEDIGARRLHTLFEKMLEDISFNAGGDMPDVDVTINGEYVAEHLGADAKKMDMRQYIL